MDEWVTEWVVTTTFALWSQRNRHASYGMMRTFNYQDVWHVTQTPINVETTLADIYALPAMWEVVL